MQVTFVVGLIVLYFSVICIGVAVAEEIVRDYKNDKERNKQ